MTTESKQVTYTPGPWETAKWSVGDDIAIKAADGQWIADVVIDIDEHEKSETEQSANARLIASAPELLEALAGLVEMALCAVGNRDNGPDFDRALDSLEREAKKAEQVIWRAMP